jgi:exopolysaccharide transport family protein
MNVVRQFPHPAPAKIDDYGSKASFLNLRAFLSREWRFVALVTGIFFVLAILYVTVSANRYTARVDLIIETKKVVWVQSEMSSESRGTDDGAVESEIQTTKSEKVAKAVIRHLQLLQDPEFVGSGPGLGQRTFGLLKLTITKSGLSKLPGFGWASQPDQAPSESDLTLRALGTLSENLRVTRFGRSYHEEIAYTSLDPVKASKIANEFAEAYIEDQLEAKFEATRRASEWLQQRIEELRKQASDAFKAVQDFKSANGIIIGVEGKLASDVELDQLGVALAKARADTSQAQAKLDRITRVLEQRSKKQDLTIPDPVVTDALNSPIITKLRDKFLQEQNKAAEWSAKYGPYHRSVVDLQTDMVSLQSSIWDEISRIAESYKSEQQIAKSQEAAIDKKMMEVFETSSATRQSQVKLRELETSAKSYRNIYETFLARFTQSVQQQSFPSTEARVVTEATPPRKPSSPKVALTLALAFVCGLIMGIMLGVAREQMDRKFRTREQLETLAGTNCIAVLPGYSQPKNLVNAAMAAVRRLRANNAAMAFREISRASPFSATAEALRYIKVALDLHAKTEPNPNKGKVIGIVSALSGEGKTTVATAFASFAARNNDRTLLIDADLRNPSMTKALGHPAARGLLHLATGDDDFRKLVVADPEFKFDFLPGCMQGKLSSSSDVLNSPSVKNMLEKARNDYEYVLVDLPPILPVVDVVAVAHLIDAFVLVVEWGSTSVDEVVKAIGSSPVLRDRLVGAVLNKADVSTMRRLEGYSDRHYTYYARQSA